MNKTKAILVLVIALGIAVAVCGWYIHTIEVGVEENTTPTLAYGGVPCSVENTFLISYTSNHPLNHTPPLEIVNWTPDYIRGRIRVEDKEITMKILLLDDLHIEEFVASLTTNNTKIRFNADALIPPIECDLKKVEYVGYDMLTTMFGDEHGGDCYDLGHYNLTFQIPPPVYDYEVEVLSNIKIGAVEASFFNFETIAFSDGVGEPQPFSNWHHYTGTLDMGDLYFVRVVPEDADYKPKMVTPELVHTKTNYERIEGELVELVTREYGVDVFFGPLDVGGGEG